MINRDIYFFDDFTLENYRRLLSIAVNNGFQFIFHKDSFVPERKDLIWRHDVEFEPDIALEMAGIEAEVGVNTSYFFQLHSSFYNLFDPHYREVFFRIKELGHTVGLHFDCRYWGISDCGQLDEFITLDRVFLEKNFNVKVDTFSFHNTTPFTQSCVDFRYGGLINVYSSFFKDNFSYCADSLGYWRFDRLEDIINNNAVRHLQVLIHDGNWSKTVLSPRKRLSSLLHEHAERLLKEQVEGLHRMGHLCPDDDQV